LDIDTKRRIDTARDILVGKLPDPKSQVEQITIALIYKFMDDMDKQSEELGGKAKFFTGEFEKYSWSKIFDPRVSGFDLVNLYSEAIQRMNHNPNIPSLFREIFKNAYLPYRDPETLKMFLKVIGEFKYDHSERLGDAYEQLLSIMGSQGDAGQFRTPRHIIDFMVEVTDPQKNETILDPACGTAGFLIFSYNHILNKNRVDSYVNLSPEERAKLVENIAGYDISPDMVRIALVNMYLHGFQNPKIYEYDTLASEDRWNEYYDIMLANPPFMSPRGGVRPHKRFSIQSKRSEVLFVDYIAEHLTPHGRGAVIVPEGIIFQSGTAYKKLRKSLIENSLYAVVSLPAGVFNPYSGVKTSILFLNKNLAKKTDNILFVKINNDGYGLGAQRRKINKNDLPPALATMQKYQQSINENTEFELNANDAKLAHIVKKEKIAESGDNNLSGERYRETLVYSGKWDFVQLGEICDIYNGSTPLRNNKDYWENGTIPWFTIDDIRKQGRIIYKTNQTVTEKALNETSIKLLPKNSVLLCCTASIGEYAISKIPLTTNQQFNGLVIKKELINKILPNYLFWMVSKFKPELEKLGGKTSFKFVSIKNVKTIKIPLPPLEIQEQIVAELESYQKIIDGARQVVENYKPIFKIDPDWELVELGKVMKVNQQTINPKEKFKNNDCIYIDITSVENGSGIVSFDNKIKTSNAPSRARRRVKNGDILLSTVRPNLKAFCILNEIPPEAVASTGFAVLSETPAVYPPFVYYQLFNDFIEKQMISRMGKGSYPSINQRDVEELKIYCPPIEIQKKIANEIENEQKIIDANKELIKIYEQKVKDKISEVWGE
jgi:type I restriction enzyme M protein